MIVGRRRADERSIRAGVIGPVTFDEYGNYVPPDEKKKNGGSKSGWVN